MRSAFSFWLGSQMFLSPFQKKELTRLLGSAEAAYHASETELSSILGEEKTARFCAAVRESGGRERVAETYLSYLRRGYGFCSIEDAAFPEKLRGFPNDPYGLFTRGGCPDGSYAAAVIGARRATGYGMAMADVLGRAFAAAKIPVISGMARGIDSRAQKSVLAAGGKTIAVLGSGIDICYPAEMRSLYEEIGREGILVSEYPPGVSARPYRFPQRNRIIAALSDLVIVLEAGEKSGTRITAEQALDYGRDVYAMPGRIDDGLSRGCNELLRLGAGVLLSKEQLFQDLGIVAPQQSDENDIKKGLAPEDDLLYSCVGLHPKSLDILQSELNCGADDLLRRLTALELKGLVGQIAPGAYVRL